MRLLKRFLAALFLALGLAGGFAFAPAASADPLLHFNLQGALSDDVPEEGPLACVNPHIEIFGNVLLEDPICV